MKDPRAITEREQYARVYRQGTAWANSLIVLKAAPNRLTLSRYGFSVTKRVGKAVQRNRVKRVLREIMRLQSLKPGWDIVFIARSAAVNADYHQVEGAVIDLLTRAQLLEN